MCFDLGSPRGQIPLLVVVSFTFSQMSETMQGGGELVAVVEQTAPIAQIHDLKMLKSSLSMIQQQGHINAEKMSQYMEKTRVIVQRKVLVVLENDLVNRSDALELLRMSLFANGWADDGVFTCPAWKVAMKIWPAVIECLDVLIEERQRESSVLGKRSADELDQGGEELTAAQRAFQGSQLEGVINTPTVLQADAVLRKAATAVLPGGAEILPAEAASGKKPVISWMDVDMSLLNKEAESDGQLRFDPTSGAIKYDRNNYVCL
jgi:hypothetical protein